MPRFLSRRPVRRALALASLCLLGALGPVVSPAAAQAPGESATPPTEATRALDVGRIMVEGNAFTDSTRILRTFEVRTGQSFSADAVRRGTRKLIALGLFSNVVIRRVVNTEAGVVDLVIVVTERPRIARIEFQGQRKREEADLERKLFLKVGETYSATATARQVDTLTHYYREEGFARAKVSAQTDSIPGRNEVTLRFVIAEGEKVRITRILFEGLTAFPEKRLRKVMKTKAKGFLGGGDLKDETFAEDREKLETWYHDHGYRDMSVAGFELDAGAKPRELVLRVQLAEGRRYTMGKVEWSGASVMPLAVLEKQWPRKGGPDYSKGRIQRAVSGAYSEYAERGYLYVGIEPRETVVRDSVVDLVLGVTEGGPSRIRRISITGNKGTREKVIRREIDVREGDIFRRSALVRSQSDVMRLGIFNEVMPDFTPAESTDVDLVFRITEKQVGTASAGAGFTNESGLTGFLDIGHNNVLGNGQQVQLHLERGGRRQDYQLSFTEPWFRDTPTLLGFSVYNTFRSLDEYDQRRRGGSGRIGRPLPWPDYSRGSVSYTLESMEFSNLRTGITLGGGIVPGQAQLTSTLELNFLRNSTDNPFYPTRGTRLSLNEEITGGPFGGDIDYHRHRIEGRLYLPSILKRITSMFRVRIGALSGFELDPVNGGQRVPDYARFRLGGGNTMDPLRGYDDYMVVPDKFIRFVNTSLIQGIDSTSTPGQRDTTFRQVKVRYPGGRFMTVLTFEQQFAIAHPLHALLFVDAGNTWDLANEIKPFDLKVGAGIGFRMEVPLLGNIGFDYGYGFHRDDKPRWTGHFMLGNVNF